MHHLHSQNGLKGLKFWFINSQKSKRFACLNLCFFCQLFSSFLLSVYCVLRCYSGRDKVNCWAIKYNVYIICFRRDIFTIVYLLIVCSSLKCSQCSQLSGLIVSLYLESEKQSSLDSSITPRFSDLNGPSTCHCSLSCLTSGLLHAHVCFEHFELLSLQQKATNTKHGAKVTCRSMIMMTMTPDQYNHCTNNKWPLVHPPLERRVKWKSGHLTPVTLWGSSRHCFDEESTESFDAVIPGMHSSNSGSWSGVFLLTTAADLFTKLKVFTHHKGWFLILSYSYLMPLINNCVQHTHVVTTISTRVGVTLLQSRERNDTHPSLKTLWMPEIAALSM